jgi:glycosyltransferase involved in cell wall biosynthesis
LDRGGAETQLLVLVKQQVLKGYRVSVLYLKGSGELTQSFEDLGVQVIRVAKKNNFFIQVFSFGQYLRRIKYLHVVHAHLPQAELVATFSILSKTRLVNSRHFGGQFHPTALRIVSRLLGKLATLRSYKVIAISNSVKDNIIALNEVNNKVPIDIVHYGIEQKFSNRVKLNQNRQSQNVLRVGTVARLSPEKDLETLIKSFRILKNKKKEVRLEIVGAGSLLGELTTMTKDLGLTNSVSFLGRTDDVEGFISSLDLFVLTSKFEGFGMVLLEAMSTGCKIVAARNSAIPEVLGEDGAGLMFETGNETELAEKILDSLNSQDETYKILQIRRLELFSAEEMCRKVLLSYR